MRKVTTRKARRVGRRTQRGGLQSVHTRLQETHEGLREVHANLQSVHASLQEELATANRIKEGCFELVRSEQTKRREAEQALTESQQEREELTLHIRQLNREISALKGYDTA